MSGSLWNDFVNEPGFGGGKRLKDWKSQGQVIVWIHTNTKIHKRLFHMLPYVGTKTDDSGKEKSSILYFPFVCHEDPNRMQAKETPVHCPICRFMDYLNSTTRVEDGDIVWEASVRDRKRDRVVTKADFIGNIEAGGDWRLSFKPALQYIMGVIKHPEGNETPELVIATEKYSLGEAIKRAVRQEIDSKGPEEGDPAVTPYAFKWVFDQNARIATQYYSAYRYDIAKLTPAISEVLGSPAPELSSYISPGDTKKLREVMEKSIPSEIIDTTLFDELFSNVKVNQGTEIEPWDDDDEEEEKSEVKEVKPAKRRGRPPLKRTEPKEEPRPKKEEPKKEPPQPEPPKEVVTSTEELPVDEPCILCKGSGEWRGRTCIDCGGSGEKKDRVPEKRVRTARKPKVEPPPPPPPSDDDVVCGKCGAVVHEDDIACPECGAEFE